MKLLILSLFTTIVWANLSSYKTFEADFEQIIKNPSNNTIQYKGHIITTEKNLYWEYQEPISKQVYILGSEVIINEPELEQTIYTTLKNEINIIELLKHAKQIDAITYEAKIDNTIYTLTFKDDLLFSIFFKDEIENAVTILFTHQIKNQSIDSKTFLFDQDPNFDIIKQ